MEKDSDTNGMGSATEMTEKLGTWTWVTDWLLCLSSYTPMFLALGFRFDSPRLLRSGCFILAGVGLVATLYFVFVIRLNGSDNFVIATVNDRGSDVSGYLATYLLPIIVVGTPTNNDIIAYSLVLAVMSLVYVRSKMIAINPMFYLLTYRLFSVSSPTGVNRFLLARRQPEIGENLRVVQHGNLIIVMNKIT